MRLTLLPEAARRLDIQTVPVREGPVAATRRFGGEVISVHADRGTAIVQVYLTEDDAKSVRREEPAFVLPLARETKPFRVRAAAMLTDAYGLSGPFGATQYEVSNAHLGLVTLQLVFVEVPVSGSGEHRTIIPYGAVMYDPHGDAWVYTNPEPLVFIRQPIQIDTIAGDDVILRDGPATGTAVVTVGAAELYGAERGVGK